MIKIIDLYADWCSPCKKQASVLEEISDIYTEDEVCIEKINIETNKPFVDKYNVSSIPTLIFEKDGVFLEKHVGLMLKNDLIKKINLYN